MRVCYPRIASASARSGPARLPYPQLRFPVVQIGCGIAALDLRDQASDRRPAPIDIDRDRRERRAEVGRFRDVVETDHADVVRDANATLGDGSYDSERHLIV